MNSCSNLKQNQIHLVMVDISLLKIKTYLTLRVKLEFPVEARCWKPAERTAYDEINRKDRNDHILEMRFVNTKPIHSPLPTDSGCDHLNLRTLWYDSNDGKLWTPLCGVRGREVAGLKRIWLSSPLLFLHVCFNFMKFVWIWSEGHANNTGMHCGMF